MDRRYRKRITRYWAAREKAGLHTLSRLDMESWFDWWHMHPDWKGKGDRCPDNRKVSVEVVYRLLQEAEKLRNKASKPIQCWALIASSAYDDAVYMHSENPHGTPPYDFSGVEWDSVGNEMLSEVVDSSTHRIGKLQNESEALFFILARPLPGAQADGPAEVICVRTFQRCGPPLALR